MYSQTVSQTPGRDRQQPVRRHIALPTGDHTHRTTLRLEREFWERIDHLADSSGLTWRDWVARVLADKPDGVGSASWLRVTCMGSGK